MLRLEKYIKMKVKGELKITYGFNFWLVLVLTICKILVLAFYTVAPKLRTREGGTLWSLACNNVIPDPIWNRVKESVCNRNWIVNMADFMLCIMQWKKRNACAQKFSPSLVDLVMMIGNSYSR